MAATVLHDYEVAKDCLEQHAKYHRMLIRIVTECPVIDAPDAGCIKLVNKFVRKYTSDRVPRGCKKL